MVDYTTLPNILTKLDSLYSTTGGTDLDIAVLASKMAIMEFSGWIEQSMDDILNRYIDAHILNSDCIVKTKRIISSNYGFSYDKNFYKIITNTVGTNNWENIVDTLGTGFSIFESMLNTYTASRNTAAHTYIGVTRTFNSPAIVLADFRRFCTVFQTIETEIQRL